MKAVWGLLLIGLLMIQCREEEMVTDPRTEILRQLQNPDTVRTELSQGYLSFRSPQVYLRDPTYRPARFYTLEADSKTFKLQRAQWQHYDRIGDIQVCQHAQLDWYYREDGLIDQVVYTNPCREGTSVGYQYHYDQGVLKSIESPDTSVFIHEWYFSYHPDGQVSTIFSNFSHRDGSTERSFTKWSFTYDSLGNVVKAEVDGPYREYTEYTYTYDNQPNPFYGLFLLQQIVYLPSPIAVGPFFLSRHNVVTATMSSPEGDQRTEQYTNLYRNGQLTGFISSEGDTLYTSYGR